MERVMYMAGINLIFNVLGGVGQRDMGIMRVSRACLDHRYTMTDKEG